MARTSSLLLLPATRVLARLRLGARSSRSSPWSSSRRRSTRPTRSAASRARRSTSAPGAGRRRVPRARGPAPRQHRRRARPGRVGLRLRRPRRSPTRRAPCARRSARSTPPTPASAPSSARRRRGTGAGAMRDRARQRPLAAAGTPRPPPPRAHRRRRRRLEPHPRPRPRLLPTDGRAHHEAPGDVDATGRAGASPPPAPAARRRGPHRDRDEKGASARRSAPRPPACRPPREDHRPGLSAHRRAVAAAGEREAAGRRPRGRRRRAPRRRPIRAAQDAVLADAAALRHVLTHRLDVLLDQRVDRLAPSAPVLVVTGVGILLTPGSSRRCSSRSPGPSHDGARRRGHRRRRRLSSRSRPRAATAPARSPAPSPA